MLRTLVFAVALVSVLPPAYAARDAGAYVGRQSLIGLPVIGMAADPSGALALAQQGVRLEGDRVYAGYRFGSGLGVEGAQHQAATRNLTGDVDTLSLAGTVSLPLADDVVATAKAGMHVAESSVLPGPGRFGTSATGSVLGLTLAYRASKRVVLTAESQHLTGSSVQTLGALPSQTYLVGARVQF
jgi:hypothetical protein